MTKTLTFNEFRTELFESIENDSLREEILTESILTEQIEKVIAWFLAKLYLMDDKDAEQTLNDAIANRNALLAANNQQTESIDEGLKEVGKNVLKFTKPFIIGGLKMGAFNILAGLLGTSPYLVTILGNISIGIIQDIRQGVGIKKTIMNIAKRALSAAAFTLFMQIISPGGYEHATITGNEDSDKNALEKIGSLIKRTIAGKAENPNTTIEYEAPKNLGAAIKEFIPGLAKNSYVNGRIIDPKNAEHFVSRSELVGGAALREWDKFINPIFTVWNKIKSAFSN